MIAFVKTKFIRAGIDGMYVVGCVIVPGTGCDESHCASMPKLGSTSRMRARRAGRPCCVQSANADERNGWCATCIAGLPKGQTRARNLCLNRLLWDLMTWGVDELVIESRQAHNDRFDRIIVVAAQQAKREHP